MSAVLVDATFLVGLLNRRDQWHAQANALLPWAERQELHIHALAAGEVIAMVGKATGGVAAREAYVTMRDTMTIHAPTIEDLDAAMEFVLRYDGKLSLSDALFLHLAQQGTATRILSFDADFDGKGIERVATPPLGGKRAARR